MATLYWFGGAGSTNSSANWSTVAPCAFTGTMTGTNTLTVAGLTGTALAVGKTVKTCDQSYTGIITGGVAPNWTMDTVGTFSSVPCGGGTAYNNTPTTTDNVIFDANAGNTTVSSNFISLSTFSANNVTTTTPTTTLWAPTTGAAFDAYGSVSIGANFTLAAGAGGFGVYMNGGTAGTSLTISKSGVCDFILYNASTTFTQAACFVNYSSTSSIRIPNGATVTITGAMSTAVFDNSGACTTGAGLTHNISDIFSHASFATSLNISGSNIIVGNSWSINASPITTNASTTITLGSATPGGASTFTGGANSYLGIVNIIGTSAQVLDSGNTFNSFTRTGAADTQSTLYFIGDQTVTGPFTLQGNSATLNRLFVSAQVLGSTSTTTLNSATLSKTLKWVDLQDITITNTGTALTPTLVGDCGGNTVPAGTFPAAITCYAKTAGSAKNYSDNTLWFDSGGAASRVPLAQDSVVFNSASGSGAITIDCRVLGKNVAIDSAYTGSFTSTYATPMFLYGNFTGTGISTFTPSPIAFAGRSNITLPTSLSLPWIIILCYGATVTLGGNYTAGVLDIVSSTLNTSTYDLTVGTLREETNWSTGTPGFADNFYGSLTATSGTITIIVDGVAILNSFTPGTSNFVLQGQTVNSAIDPMLTVSNFLGLSFYKLTFAATDAATSKFIITLNSSVSFNSWENTSTVPITISLPTANSPYITDFNMQGTATSSVFMGYDLFRPGSASSTGQTFTATQVPIYITNPVTTAYVLYKSINFAGAGTVTATTVANMGNNTGAVSFTSSIRGYALTGTVGSNTTGSFVVPGNIRGSNAFIVLGGGGGSARRNSAAGSGGGGAGSFGVVYNLPITGGQTIYYQVGGGGTGGTTSTGQTGGNGGTSWVNITTNAAPTVNTDGALAYGGGGSIINSTAGGIGANAPIAMFGSTGPAGGAATGRSAGSGAAPASLKYGQGSGGTAGVSTVSYTGGSGGAGQAGAGFTVNGSGGGTGGNNLNGARVLGPSLGNPGNTGTVGGGGSGGGGGSVATAGGAGGASSQNEEFTYINLDGSYTSGSIGPSGGAGAGGYNTTGVGGAGGSPSYGGGAGGSGGGSVTANNGNGGNGGVGLVIFLYEYSAGNNGQAIFIG
jgi:hypothetical protein